VFGHGSILPDSAISVAVTLVGIELAHRIRKRQLALPYKRKGRALSLKELWDNALSHQGVSETLEKTERPLTHKISIRSSPPRLRGRRARSAVVRYARKIFFGHSLYLLVMPNGARGWRFRYRFEGREKMISLGRYPEVPPESAWARHRAARQLLALGVDPVCRRQTLRRISTEPN
jgi:hypothetical protein